MRFRKKQIILATVIGCIVYAALLIIPRINSVNSPSTKQYNLILLSIDTLRPDHMGIYGYDKNTTPHIDSWARNAHIFTQVYTQVPATYPSFASLFTGVSPFISGIYNNATSLENLDRNSVANGDPKLPANLKPLAEVLHGVGYITAAFIGNIVLDPELSGLNRGFTTYDLIYNDANKKTESDSEVANSAQEWLEKRTDKKQPFFLWVHLLGPHAPYLPPNEFKCKFNKAYCNEIAAKGLLTLEKERQPLGVCTNPDKAKEKAQLYETLYDGEIAYADKLVGNILEAIKRSGFDKNSIIVLYGDHGEGFDHKYYYNHGYVLYNSAVHIPFIIYTPTENAKGEFISSRVINTQIFSLLLSLLGVKERTLGFKTKSFQQIIQDSLVKHDKDQNTENNTYFMNVARNSFAIQEKNYKYIYSASASGNCFIQQDELYDVIRDPQELDNLADSNQVLVTRLRSKLFTYLLQNPVITKNVSPTPTASQEKVLQKLRGLGY